MRLKIGNNKLNNYFKSLLIESDFIRNIFILTSGTVFAQAIYFFSTPILSRIYSPEDFGHFTLFISIVSVVGIIATLTYEMSIVLPKSDKYAVNLLALTFLTSILTAAITYLLILGGFNRLGHLANFTGYSYYLWLLPLGILGLGIEQSISFWFTRKNQFKMLASYQVIQSSSATFLMVMMGIINTGYIGLIAGRVFGRIISLSYLCRNWWVGYSHLIKQSVSTKEIKIQARAYNKFLKFNFGAELINAFSQSVPFLLLAYFFDATIVGLYGMAYKVVAIPMLIAAKSIQQVFYPKANEICHNNGSLRKLLINTTVGLVKFWVAPFLILMLFGKIIFSVIFGSEWEIAGTYAQIIAPLFFFGIINPLFISCLFLLGYQKVKLFYEISLCIVRLLSIYVGYIFWKSALISILLFGVSGFLLNLAFVIFVFNLVKKKEKFV